MEDHLVALGPRAREAGGSNPIVILRRTPEARRHGPLDEEAQRVSPPLPGRDLLASSRVGMAGWDSMIAAGMVLPGRVRAASESV